MPTTLSGLLLFIVLLLPGFTFLWIYTFDRPARRLTVLQETGAVVSVSVICGLLTVIPVLAAGAIAPRLGIDTGRLITDPGDYLKTSYPLVLAWFIMSLATACALAAGAGLLARDKPVHPSNTSSWWTLFDHWHPETTRHIQCELDDGSCVTGVLGDWNTMEEESPDRDLILTAPITYRPVGDTEHHPHPVSAVCVSAGRIVTMFVAYSDQGTTSAPVSEVVEVEVEEPLREQPPAGGSAHVPDQVQASAHGYDRSRRSPSRSATPRDRAIDRRGSLVQPIVASGDR